jgi:Tfp pilus assembly protein PilF
MVGKHWPSVVALVVTLCFGLGIASVRANEESLGRQAEQAGNLRQALTHYVEALKAETTDSQLRERIIRLAQKIQPPPEVPEDAERHLARGNAAVKGAKDEQGYLRAAEEFRLALRTAPWLADVYFNLGVVLDKAGQYKEAISNLKFYLMAVPNDREAKNLIYEIEYRQEEAARQAVETKQAEEMKKKASLESLSGTWKARSWREVYYDYANEPYRGGKWGNLDYTFRVTIVGNSFSAVLQQGVLHYTFQGTITGNRIHGQLYGAAVNPCPSRAFDFEGTIWPDEKKIMLVTPMTSVYYPPQNRCGVEKLYDSSYLLDYME